MLEEEILHFKPLGVSCFFIFQWFFGLFVTRGWRTMGNHRRLFVCFFFHFLVCRTEHIEIDNINITKRERAYEWEGLTDPLLVYVMQRTQEAVLSSPSIMKLLLMHY